MQDWIIELNRKREESQEIRNKSKSEAMKGENNPRWNGGISEYPNHAELKRIRIKIFQKSKGKCEICGEPAKMVHHIDEDKSNHSIDNLIALCLACHESLHCDDNGKSFKGRPLKYNLICNMSVKEISKIFGVCTGTIYYWLKNPKKREWLKEQLNNG